MIQDREKEYEDGLFFGGLAADQKRKKEKKTKAKMDKLIKGEHFDSQEEDIDYKFEDI